MTFFSDFKYSFSSSRLTADLHTDLPQLYLIELLGLSTSLGLLELWHAGLLHKLKSYGISGQIFGLNFSFLSN